MMDILYINNGIAITYEVTINLKQKEVIGDYFYSFNCGDIPIKDSKVNNDVYDNGTSLIRQLVDSPKTTSIHYKSIPTFFTTSTTEIAEPVDENDKKWYDKNYDAKVVYNAQLPKLWEGSGSNQEKVMVKDYIALGHELIHALGIVTGDWHAYNENSVTGLYKKPEDNMSITENDLRIEHGLTPRSSY